MIGVLLFYGTLVLAVCWLVGLPGLWRGTPALSLWSSGLAVLLSAFVAIFALAGPRYSEFWMGGLGSGDGTGLIGMFAFGLLTVGVAFSIFILTVIVAVVRKQHLHKEASA